MAISQPRARRLMCLGNYARINICGIEGREELGMRTCVEKEVIFRVNNGVGMFGAGNNNDDMVGWTAGMAL